jgi:hypothetical protein
MSQSYDRVGFMFNPQPGAPRCSTSTSRVHSARQMFLWTSTTSWRGSASKRVTEFSQDYHSSARKAAAQAILNGESPDVVAGSLIGIVHGLLLMTLDPERTAETVEQILLVLNAKTKVDASRLSSPASGKRSLKPLRTARRRA